MPTAATPKKPATTTAAKKKAALIKATGKLSEATKAKAAKKKPAKKKAAVKKATTKKAPATAARPVSIAQAKHESRLHRDDMIQMIEVDRLHSHPANPASRRSKENVADLVTSIKQHGQREVVRVRPVGSIGGGYESGKAPKHGYQILSGDRRVAACRILKQAVRCEVVDCSDGQALAEVVLGNEGRVDFDPVQRARLLQQMIDGGMPRVEAGKVFGLNSESGIKNTLRLGKLPESILKLLSDGTIPARAARAIVPWAEAVKFCDHVAKILTNEKDPYILGEFIGDPVHFLFGEFETDGKTTGNNEFDRIAHGRPMDSESRPSYDHQRQPPGFTSTASDDDIRALNIVKLPIGEKGKLQRVALNVELFDKLQAPFLKKISRGSSSSASAKPKKKASEMTAKELVAEQKRKDAAAAKSLKDYTPKFVARMKRLAIASQVKANHDVITSTTAALLDMCKFSGSLWIELALASLGHAPKKTSAHSKQDFVLIEALIGGPKGAAILDRLFRILVWNQLIDWPGKTDAKFKATIEKGESRITPNIQPPKDYAVGSDPADYGGDGFVMILDAIIAATDVSLVGCWADGVHPGPQRELILEFLMHHSEPQLRTLAKSWRLKNADGVKGRKALAEWILGHHTDKGLSAPKCLK